MYTSQKCVFFLPFGKDVPVPGVSSDMSTLSNREVNSHTSWLHQIEACLKDMGMTGLAFCLGDGQTETGGLSLPGGRGDALLLRMPPPHTPDLNIGHNI